MSDPTPKPDDWDITMTTYPMPMWQAYFPDYMPPTNPVCECGAAKTGCEPYRPGHSSWCPVAHDARP